MSKTYRSVAVTATAIGMAAGALLATDPGAADAATYHQGAYDNRFKMTITTSPGKVQVVLDNQLDRGLNCEWTVGDRRFPDFAVARGTSGGATAALAAGEYGFWSKCRSHTDSIPFSSPKYSIVTELSVQVPAEKKVIKLAPKPKKKEPKIIGITPKGDIGDKKPIIIPKDNNPSPGPATPPKSPLNQLLEMFGS